LNASVKGFAPLTAGKNVTERKKALRDRIRQSINNLEEARTNCRGKALTLNVTFHLLGNSTEEGRKRKDLDNLLKLLLDVLSENMVAKGTPVKQEGLGLISDDEQIYEIHCRKKMVSDPLEEGIDLEISECRNGPSLVSSKQPATV
jgi:Holliday junction resolvase RusA-like endonuclease